MERGEFDESTSPVTMGRSVERLMKQPFIASLVAAILCLQALRVEAATITVGPFVSSTTSPFIVPIEVTGAVDLQSFAFDVQFDANAYAIDTACDPFSDAYCDFTTGPVTLGTFYTAEAIDPPLFNPGFILLDGSGNQTGQLLGVNGAWQDAESAPSGDGVLAFIEFIATGSEPDSPIAVVGPPSDETVDEPFTFVLLLAGGIAFVLESRRVRPRQIA